MRQVLLPALTLGLLLSPAQGVHAQEDARAIIERAVQAVGGLDKINQVKAAHRKSKGVYHSDGWSFTSESFSQSPDRIKIVQKSIDRDDPVSRTLVLDGPKGWIAMEGFLQTLDGEMMDRMNRARYADRVASLVTLLRDKGYTLTALGASKVKDTPVLGVQVSHQGQTDMSLFFDRSTGLLLKTAQRVPESGGKEEALHEWYLSDYRLLDLAAPDEQLLKAAKIAVDGQGLLEFVRRRTPGNAARDQIKALLGQLSDPSFRVRTQATAELKKLGPEAASLLRPALQDPDREVVRRVELCLDHAAKSQEAALIPAALRLIAIRRPTGAVPVLLAYLPWAPDDLAMEEVRAALAAVAVRDGQPDPVLTETLKHRDPHLRLVAAAALGKDDGAYRKQPGHRVIVEGLRYAAKSVMYRDGHKHMEIEVLDIQPLNRVEDAVFARPEEGPKN